MRNWIVLTFSVALFFMACNGAETTTADTTPTTANTGEAAAESSTTNGETPKTITPASASSQKQSIAEVINNEHKQSEITMSNLRNFAFLMDEDCNVSIRRHLDDEGQTFKFNMNVIDANSHDKVMANEEKEILPSVAFYTKGRKNAIELTIDGEEPKMVNKINFVLATDNRMHRILNAMFGLSHTCK